MDEGVTSSRPAEPAPLGTEAVDVAWQAMIGSIAAARRHRDASVSGSIGVTVLTGFLGSGKTTVLRRLLTEPAGLRIAAVVNDIGPFNIDAASIAGVRTADKIELTNGCVCCAMVDDLAESLERLAAPVPDAPVPDAPVPDAPVPDAPVPDAIVVEASGVADPSTLALAVQSAAGCRLDGVVAVVDALQLSSQLHDARIARAIRRQIDVSHLVVLSKADLLDGAAAGALTADIGELAPGRMVIPAAHGRIDPRVLLSAADRGAAFGAGAGGHPYEVATATVPTSQPWEPAAVARWFDDPPVTLLRAKGWFTDPSGSSHELQAVGRRWSIEPASAPVESAIVLIGDSQTSVDRAAASLGSLG